VKNRDEFERHLKAKFTSQLINLYIHDLEIQFHPFHEKEICTITAKFSKEPVFLRIGNRQMLYVREMNGKKCFEQGDEMLRYIRKTWSS
jgi:hypothetical protein